MKHLKKFEAKIKTVKSSELDNWSVDQALNKDKEKKLTGKKDLDKSLGSKVIELLAKYRLFPSMTSGDWLKKCQLILDSEKKFKEFRINIGTKQSFDNWLDWEHTGVEYDELSDDEQLKYESEYENVEQDYENVEFSVFLPLGVNDIESAMSDATKYLNTLSECLPEVYESSLDYSGILKENTNGFKKFLKVKDLKITNKNVEDVPMIEYRLYKDNKFFYHLNDFMGDDQSMKSLINDWLNLSKTI